MTYQTLLHFGSKLREARLIKGWQPHDLAHAVGITEAEVLKIEQGRADVSIVIAKEFARVLDVAITDLL
jgi:ribosome-binding protein aMBF1 (putative translation factor)